MPIITIRFSGTRLQAKRAVMYVINSVCNLQSGNLREKKSTFIRERVYKRLADKLLSLIHNEFIIKSLGGQGYDGDKWLELSPVTIAYRERRLKSINRLRKSFGLSRIRTGSILMEQILIETGALQNSLKPLKIGGRKRAAGQIVETRVASFAVGTTEKPWHHYQDAQRPARLPRRAFWPDSLPDQWWISLIEEFQMAIADEVRAELLMRGGKGSVNP